MGGPYCNSMAIYNRRKEEALLVAVLGQWRIGVLDPHPEAVAYSRRAKAPVLQEQTTTTAERVMLGEERRNMAGSVLKLR